jgi:hypothetical protein
MPKIAIITKPKNASPKVLAKCLQNFFKDNGYHADLFLKIEILQRFLSYSIVKKKYNFVAWMLYKSFYYISDQLFLKRLKSYDAIIIAETSPKIYYKDVYNISRLKDYIGDIPLVYHGVYFLGNAPTMVKMLNEKGHNSSAIFDWHLSVSEVTEIRQKPSPPWSTIGLYLKSTGLKPEPKDELFALVDFEREGHEDTRRIQIETLEALNIPYVALSGSFSIEEIREYYKKATFYFIQFGESFGVPIAECLSCGCYIFTPDSSWGMAWRLDENPQIHGPGTLADCFVVYDNREDLKKQLGNLKENYDLKETPKKVFNIFYENYPHYYDGDINVLREFMEKVENKTLKK